MNIGVVLTRCQPIHRGHTNVFKKVLAENDKLLIVLGSKNKFGSRRNPLSYEQRLNMLNKVLEDEFKMDRERIQILGLCDWTMETYYEAAKEWGSFFYYNVVNAIGVKSFNLYYNDDRSIVENWFIEDIAKRVFIRQFERDNISSTVVREAILFGDSAKLRYMMCSTLYNRDDMAIINEALIKAKNDDFIME